MLNVLNGQLAKEGIQQLEDQQLLTLAHVQPQDPWMGQCVGKDDE
ncbi:hypothetical protein H920_18126 [Fukomys damarensis]|uniref:Uncharacterized protein n=1 Tax=Fukomys damarensis TaxID=885580 RepID=A0A091CRP6_FUKDA|nr:hypothetical protein H920_18126 [Fukomys damarensis]